MRIRESGLMLLGFVMAAFLTSGCGDSKKIEQLQNEVSELNQIIKQKDAQILTASAQTAEVQKKLDDALAGIEATKQELEKVKTELITTQTELDTTRQRLASLTVLPAEPAAATSVESPAKVS